MGKIPQELRETIARNIQACRKESFPGHGGAKLCAEAFSLFANQRITPQQWSPWERGTRTPDESRLATIAAFFGKTVEYLRRDNRSLTPPVPASTPVPDSQDIRYDAMTVPELLLTLRRNRVKAVFQVEVTVASVDFVPF